MPKKITTASAFCMLVFSKLMRVHRAYHRMTLKLVDASDSASKAGFFTLNFGLVNTSYRPQNMKHAINLRILLLKLMSASEMPSKAHHMISLELLILKSANRKNVYINLRC